MVKIFVGNLSGSSVTENDLRSAFEDIGPVSEAVVMQRGGFGFVHMENKEDANQAVAALNGAEVAGTKLSVEISRPKKGDAQDVKIFIGNLDKTKITNQDLDNAFSKYGNVSEAVVVEKYGFVHMNSKDDANIAIKRLHKSELNGCIIDVQLSTGDNRRRGDPRKPSDRGGGGGGGFGDRRREMGRDPYYEDPYYSRRADPYSRRLPPPQDPYYGSRYDPRDDPYGPPPRRSLPPPPPHASYRDPYHSDPYLSDSYSRYPPAPRDSYPYDRDIILPKRDVRAGSDNYERSRNAPPPVRREKIDLYKDPYGRRREPSPVPVPERYGTMYSEYDRDAEPVRRQVPIGTKMPGSYADDSYSSFSRSSLSQLMPDEYPGEKRSAASAGIGSGREYSNYDSPAPKRHYGGSGAGQSSTEGLYSY